MFELFTYICATMLLVTFVDNLVLSSDIRINLRALGLTMYLYVWHANICDFLTQTDHLH